VRVERAVADEVPPMLLASSHPHDDVAVNVCGVRIPVFPIDCPCCLGVLTDALGDALVGERLGWVVRVPVGVVCRLALVGQNP
jgi:hypothetical protein